jgi:hypothetical protein
MTTKPEGPYAHEKSMRNGTQGPCVESCPACIWELGFKDGRRSRDELIVAIKYLVRASEDMAFAPAIRKAFDILSEELRATHNAFNVLSAELRANKGGQDGK